jgi:hypothetical protein
MDEKSVFAQRAKGFCRARKAGCAFAHENSRGVAIIWSKLFKNSSKSVGAAVKAKAYIWKRGLGM